MNKRNITVKKLYSIPDTNGASNFGGIDTDGSTIFCIKSNQAETVATLHTIKADGSADRTKLSGLNHTNGLAYHNGYLYVPLWGSKNSKKGVCRISVKDHSKKNISSDFSISNITHYKDSYFITRTATSADKTKQTFHVIQITSAGIKKIRKFYVKNPVAGDGYKTNQDIYFKDGKLYIMETKANLLKSAVLVANIGTPTASTVYSCSEVWITGNTSKWEVESMCIDAGGRVLFGMNTSSDGIYMKEEEKRMEIITSYAQTKYNLTHKAGRSHNYLVIHNTGTTASALNNIKYFSGANRNASADYFIDTDGKIYLFNKDINNYYSWHCGDGKGKYGITNANSIGIEVVSAGTEFTQKQKDSLKWLCNQIMTKYSISKSRVVRHYDASRKSCPSAYCGSSAKDTKWNTLKDYITGVITQTAPQTTDSLPYMVRVSATELNVRKEASASSEIACTVLKGEVYTITEIVYNGSTAWGKLKSGAGYISLGYTEKI